MKTIHFAMSALALAFIFNNPAAVADGTPGKKTVAKATNALKVDPAKSVINWQGKKVSGEHQGNVKLSKGIINVESNKLVGGSFDIDMRTIVNTDLTDASYNAKLIGHMKSDDFFSVEKHPVSTFKITKAEPIAGAKDGEPNYTVTGDLTIKGITNSISFPATVKVTDNRAEANAKFNVDRTKWDIKYGSGIIGTAADKIIYDDFTLDLKLVASK